MKKIKNLFHNTQTKSKLAGFNSLEDLVYFAQYDKKARETLKRIESKLCPHSHKICKCGAFSVIDEEV